MASIINEKSYSLNNQMASGSRSSLLISHVDFKRNEEEDDLMSAKCLQNKYNVLSADNKMCLNSNDINVKINGQLKNNTNNNSNNSNIILNGNISDNNITDGIAVPKFVLYPREKVQLEWKEPHKIGSGLANLGNTCFMNSVLQCLTYCPPLVNYLLYGDDDHSSKCNVGFCMTCEMTKHIRLVRNHSGDTIKPIYICRRLKSIAKHFTFGRQEDAHEFLRYVIDNMWRSCLSIHEFNNNLKLDPLSKETTAINQIFGGYHRSQVICFQCKEKSNTYDYFMDFMLDIKNVMSLDKALDKFVAPEILQHDNAYKCPRCKRKVLAKKQFTVFRAPNVATFQLKRFDYNRIFGGKITKLISYPEKLNLRPYMSENKGPPILYILNSVLVHLGPTCNSGHYFCYVRNSNGCWYLMDDSRIVQVNLNQVLNQQAYVLFYVRIDTDFHKPNPVKNFISHTTPNGVKLSSVSSPEMVFRSQKFNNNYNLHNGNFASTLNSTKLNSSATSLKPMPFEGIKHPQSMNKQKQNNCESNSSNKKGLVPYASDSSDEETSKQMPNTNGGIDCDKEKTRKLSTKISIENNHNLIVDEVEQNASITHKIENNLHKNGSISTQSIPHSRSSLNNHQNNNSTESMSCAPLAPITLKVKATTSSWHVVETALRSPSVASGSSTNSVNSTTEWTISECLPECNTNQHSKHHNHHKHRNKHNRCTSIANGNVKQVISTKNKIPHNTQDLDQTLNQSLSQHSTDVFEAQNHSNRISPDSRLFIATKNELKSDNGSHLNTTVETNESKSRDNHINDSVNQRDQSDRRSISSHRSSIDSSKDTNNRKKDTERNHVKSSNNSVNSSDENSTTSSHSREKKKYRKHKFSISHIRKDSDSDSNDDNNPIKSKHKKKKKKQKKKKHRKRDSSDSESNTSSDDNQLQWVERTKETVEKERNSNTSDSFVKCWNYNVRDLANKKRKLDQDSAPKTLNNTGNGDALNGLLKTSFRGYGDKVNSWDGGPSNLNASIEEEKRYIDANDDYDDEFDRGKTKKVKTHRTEYSSYDSNHNPFQKFQMNKHRNNGSFNSHRSNTHYDKHFKSKHNNHRSWQPHHNRYDNDRRH